MKILITGTEGFVGSYLAEYSLQHKAEVYGTAFPGASRRNLSGLKDVKIYDLDITDQNALLRLARKIKPNWIFHLAGQSNPSRSQQFPEETLRANVLGNLAVLEAARALGKKTRVLVVGSADEYGGVDKHIAAIRETHPLNPETPYAVSKVCQDLMGLAYFKNHGLHVIRTRPFNHIGPRQALGFVATDFASQIVSIEMGRKVPIMEVGNLEVVRDFSDVRDVVAGYWSLLANGCPGEVYNVGSGRGVTVGSLLEGMLALTTKKIKVDVKHHKLRDEKLRKVASIAKIKKATGWKPKIPLSQTLQDLLADWRGRLG